MSRATAVLALFFAPALAQGDGFHVELEDVGHFPIGTIKLHADSVYVHVPDWRRLQRYDRQGRLMLDADLAQLIKASGKEEPAMVEVEDFAVSPAGETVLVGPTGSGGSGLMWLDPEGSLRKTVGIADGPDIFRIGIDSNGRLCALGIAPDVAAEINRIFLNGQQSSLSSGWVSVIHYLDSETQGFTSPGVQLLQPFSSAQARDFLGGLQTSPLTADGQGNLYFVSQRKALAMVSPNGEAQLIHPPNLGRLFHLITQLAPGGEGLLVEVKEGFNQAPPHEQEQGLFILRDPVTRLFAFEPQRLQFREIYSGNDLHRLAGQFSDGTLLNARKIGTHLLIHELRQP